MDKIAQVTIPGIGNIDRFPDLRPELSSGNLGSIVSSFLNLAFVLAGVIMFIWAFIGIFQYITAGGNKEGLAKARARVTWAIVGFLFVMISFALSNYVQQVLRPNINVTIPKVSEPK